MKKIYLIVLSIFFINLISAFPICIDKTAPTNPTNLNITSSGTNIILNWDAASDEPECSGIDYYVVLRDEDIIGEMVNELNFTDLNVPYGTYSYGVYAVDKIGHNPGWIIRNDVVLSAPNNGVGTSVGGGRSSTSYVIIPLKIGNNLNLQKGVTYTFTINGEEHTLVIDSIGEKYIWVTITSNPQDVKLDFGKAMEIDVDDDGINDISLELVSLDNNGHIGIEYYYILEGEESTEVIELTSAEEGEEDAETQPNTFSRITGAVTGTFGVVGTWIIVIFLIGVIGSAITVRQIRKRKRL